MYYLGGGGVNCIGVSVCLFLSFDLLCVWTFWLIVMCGDVGDVGLLAPFWADLARSKLLLAPSPECKPICPSS